MTTLTRTAAGLALLAAAAAGRAADKSFPGVVRNYDAPNNRIAATFDPPRARPGETVTFRLTLELPAGWHTYPTRQPNPKADAFVTNVEFPPAGDVVFVGDVKEPRGTVHTEELIGKLIWLDGKVVWERPAVVSPRAKPGPVTVRLKRFVPQVCDKDTCLLTPRGIVVEAPLEVLDGPPAEVDAKYRAEVEKAGK